MTAPTISVSDSKASDARARPRRPWRDHLEAFGVAILAAVLLKPMVIEAYQIPTSSMQPTLMGSPEAGVYDRILVDKLRYEVFEPKRWDIVVFRYPIRRNQNYVKRIVGVPGDRLRIAGGNLWHVGEGGAVEHVHRKPDRLQEDLWKAVFPARLELDRERGRPKGMLGEFFEGPIGSWSQRDDSLVGKASPSGRLQLTYTDLEHRGLSNQIYDGYPAYIAAELAGSGGGGNEGVQDVRMAFTLNPRRTPSWLSIDLRIQPPGRPSRLYQLLVEEGVGRLRIEVGDEQTAASEPFDCPLPAGVPTLLAFAHIDDRLVAWIDGEQRSELEVGDSRVVELLAPGQVSLMVNATGGEEILFSDIGVDRDLHYVPRGLEDDLAHLVEEGQPRAIQNHVIEVPQGHFFMMGDNTLASADSRQWLAITLGKTADGWLADPARAEPPEVVALTGNQRPWSLNSKPDPDENPVIVRSGDPEVPDLFAFTDANGEVHALKGKIAPDYDQANMQLMDVKGGGARWTPPQRHVYFVPREHILGRPVAGFWPAFRPCRLGFIR